jgi:hypothetical protein
MQPSLLKPTYRTDLAVVGCSGGGKLRVALHRLGNVPSLQALWPVYMPHVAGMLFAVISVERARLLKVRLMALDRHSNRGRRCKFIAKEWDV